ncbi:MAG: gliding motility-associated protein GldE [Muribaculaceae bacterium]|nr:gliding motility-associated protein GldE [Muribaculaceae bacterium]
MDIDPLPACLIQAAVTQLSVGQILALALALVSLLLSGFISGCEISFFSLQPTHEEEVEDSPQRDSIMALLSNPERLLATILIANNIVNVTIVMLCTYALTPLFESLRPEWLNFVLQTVILTFLILLFGEILPKLIANNYPVKWAERCSGGLKFLVKICYPLSTLLVKSSVVVSHVVKQNDGGVTADDLSKALEYTETGGNKEDKEMLEGILKFGDTTASEIMTPRVDITDIDLAMDFPEVMKVVVDSGYSRLPVYEGTQDNIKGVLYARDLLPYIGMRDQKDFDWRRLIREPYFVPESRMIDDLMEDFRKLKIHIAIVIDEFGGTQGVVTLEDVLEEIVGDINDEYDDEESFYKRLPDDAYIFEGKTLLTDFFRVTGLDESDYREVAEDAETLAGMLLTIKGDFPKKKEPLVYGRCRFLILDIDHHRISSVRVKVMDSLQE